MAHALKMKVIAEGVEKEDQLAFLHKHHCDEIQGFIYSKAVPPEKINQLLLEDNGINFIKKD